MKQFIGLLSFIALMTLGQATLFAQGQPHWVLEKKAKKEAYKKDYKEDKDYYKEKMKAHKEVHKKHNHKHHNGQQAKDVRQVRKWDKSKGKSRGTGEYGRGRKCGNEGSYGQGGTDRTNRGTNTNREIENRRGNTNTTTPYPRTTSPTNEKVKVVTKPTTPTSTKPRMIVRPQPTTTPTTTPTTSPTDGGLKGRRAFN